MQDAINPAHYNTLSWEDLEDGEWYWFYGFSLARPIVCEYDADYQRLVSTRRQYGQAETDKLLLKGCFLQKVRRWV